MSRTCRSCGFFGGKVERKYYSPYLCQHPILVQLTGGELDSLKSSCVLYVERRKKKEVE